MGAITRLLGLLFTGLLVAGAEAALQAQGPEIVLEQPVGTELTDGESFMSFGDVAIGGSAVLTYTIRNTGSGTLSGLEVVRNGRDAQDFEVSALGATSLGSGDSTTFTVTFSPSVAGGRSAGLQILSNDGDESPFDIALLGSLPTAAHALHQWTNLAGQPGGVGNVGGIGIGARFQSPRAVALDNGGNIYVADSANHIVRKISPSGVVTTLAGSPGLSGSSDGTGSAARFSNPGGVAVDFFGNVYVADSGNHTIRKITPEGIVATLAGSAGLAGTSNGSGNAARFNSPAGVAVDGSGNVYVADFGSHTIRQITSAGVVSTLAGSPGLFGSSDGVGSSARFNSPRAVAVNGSGQVIVADTFNNTIRVVTSAGAVSTLAGTAGASGSGDGTGAAARFHFPHGVAVDGGGNIHVADSNNHTIRLVTPGAVVTTRAGSAGASGTVDGAGSVARFNSPSGVAVDAGGNLHIADTSNHTIRKLTSGNVVATVAGSADSAGNADGVGTEGRFMSPRGVAVDSAGNVYVSDYSSHTLRKISPAGEVSTLAGMAGVSGSTDATGHAARFNLPFGVGVDGGGNVYVADYGNHVVRKVTPAGAVTTFAGSAGAAGSTDGTAALARFTNPTGVAVDAVGNVYVADSGNHIIRRITPTGNVTTLAGSAGNGGSSDGSGGNARFSFPSGVAVDSVGNLYIADFGNRTVRKINTSLTVSTLAGSAGASGTSDGGSAARFNLVQAIAVDSAGNVYVPDQGSHTIRRISPIGVVSTIGGVAGVIDARGGAGAAAGFSSPSGVALSSTGKLFVADAGNHRIVVADPLPDVAVEQPEGTLLVDGASSVAYAGTLVATSVVRTFTVRNTAVGSITGLSISTDGSHAADFVAGAPGSVTLASGASTSFTVTFTPQGVGARSATLRVVSDDADESPYDISLTGTGLNNTPIISNIINQEIAEDNSTPPIPFTIEDVETAPSALILSAGSTNTALIPVGNIVFGGSGSNRTMTVTPAANQSGSATITIQVSDGTATASDTLLVTVSAVNDTPTITDIADLGILEDSSTGTLPFTISDVETLASALIVTGSSNNTTLVPNGNITFGGSGANRTVAVTPAANQTGSAIITVQVSDGAEVAADTFMLTVHPTNDPPSISNIGDMNILEDANTAAVPFLVEDAETPASALTVSALSTNGTLVPLSNIVFGGSGSNRTVTVSPAPNQHGSTTITIRVNDGSQTVSDSFLLTVTAMNDSPTIGDISDQAIVQGGNTGAIPFMVGDVETSASALTLSGSSSNTTLVPNANIVFAGAGANRTVRITPAAGQSGVTTITVQVSDGSVTSTDTFEVSVNAPEITVEQPEGFALVDGAGVNFGMAPLVTGSAPSTFTIRNDGFAPLTGIVLSKTGTHQADFVLNISGLSSSLQPGAATTFSVTFTPGAQGSRTAALRISSNDVDENPFDIVLVGSGPVPDITVEQPVGTALVNSSAAIDFGTVGVAGVSAARQFTIMNDGSAGSSLRLTSVSCVGGNAGDFQVTTSGMAASLAEGARTSFSVVFSPVVTGARSTTLRLVTDDADESPFEITLHGMGQNSAFGTLAFASPVNLVPEGVGTANISVIRTGGSDGSVSVRVNAVNVTATAADRGPVNNVLLSFAPGQTTRTIPVAIVADALNEPNEDFNLVLSSYAGGAIAGTPSIATVRIIDSMDGTAPSAPSISIPAANAPVSVDTGDEYVISGTAADNKGVKSVTVKLNNGLPQEATLGSPGTPGSTWTLAITPGTGLNTLTLQSTDTRDNPSPLVTRSFTVLRPLAVEVDPALGSVTTGYAAKSYREVGKSISISASAKAPSASSDGSIFKRWVIGGQDVAAGNIAFTPQRLGMAASSLEKNTITFIFREGLLLAAEFVENPYPPMAGAYQGLVQASDALPDRLPLGGGAGEEDGSVRSNVTQGHMSATVMNTGAFSGKLTIDGLVLNVAGTFDHEGQARFGSARSLTLVVPRSGKPSLVVSLDINSQANEADEDVDDKIGGTVTVTDFQRSAIVGISEIEGDRAYYNGTTLLVPGPYLSPGGANGTFTAVLPAKPVFVAGDEDHTQREGFTVQDYPQGGGIATVTVSKAGLVTMSGTLADGTAWSASSSLSRIGPARPSRFPLFSQLYNKSGFLSGFVTLDSNAEHSDMSANSLWWLRPPQAAVQHYPAGWPETIKVGFMAARYTVVGGESALRSSMGLGLQLADADGNAFLTFRDGMLTEVLGKHVNLSPADLVTKVPDNDPTYTLMVNRSTGAVTGSFAHTDDTVPSYGAMIYQKGPDAGAYGYFLSKQPAVIDYMGESGGVSLIGNP